MLREYRLQRALSQADLARRAGMSVRGISDLERGVRKTPHPNTVRQLADALELQPAEWADLIRCARRPESDSPIEDGQTPTEATAAEAGISLRTAVVALDVHGNLMAMNEAAEQLIGTSAHQAIGQPYTRIFGPSLADRVLGLFLRVARSGKPGEPEVLTASMPDGRRTLLRASLGPLYDASGQLVGVLFVAEEQRVDGGAIPVRVSETTRSERLYQALERYVGPGIAAAIDARPSFMSVGGVRQTVSVLHADVRGYTQMAERLAPEEVMQLLLRYHGAAVAALRSAGATLDRFIGDSILAIWNAPNPQENHARLALGGALALQKAVHATGGELEYGVGVHSGDVVVGNLGTAQFMNYTAVGDTVNVAARLQATAAAGEVLCSAAVLHQASGMFRTSHIGAVAVKGRAEPIDTYKLELEPTDNVQIVAEPVN